MGSITFNVALIVVLILFPGAIVRRGYNTHFHSNYHVRSSDFSEVIITLGIGAIAQIIAISFINWIHGFVYGYAAVDLPLIINLINNQPAELEWVEDKFNLIIAYNLLLNLFCFIFSRIAFLLVFRYGLDVKVPLLRFDNDWYYIIHNRSKLNYNTKLLWPYAHIAVTENSVTFIYTGFVRTYTLDRKGDLEFITLFNVKRRVFTKENEDIESKTMYQFRRQNTIVIPYSQILNISFNYNYSPEEELAATDTAPTGPTQLTAPLTP